MLELINFQTSLHSDIYISPSRLSHYLMVS